MIYCFYSIILVKNNGLVVSNPYRQNFSMAQLCDKARELSIENEDTIVSIYKHFIESPTSVKLLYRFLNGRLVING